MNTNQDSSSASVASDSPNTTTRQANRPVLFVMSRKLNTAALFEASCFEHLQAMFRVGIALPDGTHTDGIGRCRNASQFAIKCARGGTRIQCYEPTPVMLSTDDARKANDFRQRVQIID